MSAQYKILCLLYWLVFIRTSGAVLNLCACLLADLCVHLMLCILFVFTCILVHTLCQLYQRQLFVAGDVTKCCSKLFASSFLYIHLGYTPHSRCMKLRYLEARL